MTQRDPADWPEPGTIATLVWAQQRHRVRVEQVEANLPLVLLPKSAPPPPDQGPVDLQWSDAHGLYLRPIGIDRVRPRLLQLHALGPVGRVQRRRFFRAGARLGAMVSDGRQRADGLTQDLSEGGARIKVRGQTPPPNARVVTRLTTGQGGVDVPGRVIRNTPEADGVELSVLFDELPATTESVIRREVYNAQLESRRKETDQ